MLENRLSENNILVGEIQDQVIDLRKEEQEKVVEPRKEDVVVLPDDAMKVLSKVTVKGVTADIDENIKAENIKLGVNILGIEGNVAPDKPDQEKTIYPSEEEQIVKADNGFELAKVIAKPVETESFEITPSTSEQVVKASDGKFIKEVKVGAVEDIEPEIAEQEQKLETLGIRVDELPVDKPEQDKIVVPSNEQQTIVADEGYKLGSVIVEPQESYQEDLLAQKATIDELAEDVNALKDVSNETLTINENGEYDVKDYGKVVVSVGDKNVEIDLPEEFASATKLYHFVVNSNVILISSDVQNSGLWVYKNNTSKISKIYNIASTWICFQNVGDKCLIASNVSYEKNSGILEYDIKTDTINQIYDEGYSWSRFIQVDDRWLICSSNSSTTGLLMYNPQDSSVIKVYDSGYQWGQYIHNVKNNYILGSGSSGRGLLLYDTQNKTITQIYASGYSWTNIIEVGDIFFLCSTNTNIDSQGILKYNSTDNSCVKIYEEGSSWYFAHIVGNNCLFSSGASTYTGILLYNSQTDTITKIYNNNYSWRYSKTINNTCLLSTDLSGDFGILLYNDDDKTIEQKYNTSSYYNIFHKIGDRCLISSTSNSNGILLYDYDTKTITQIYETGRMWSLFNSFEDKCLLSSEASSNSNGLLLYNYNTNTIELIRSTGYNYKYFQQIGNKCLVSSSYTTGLFVYDLSDDSIDKIYTGGSYAYFKVIEDKCLISSDSNVTGSKGLLLYKLSDNSIVKVFAEGYKYVQFVEDNGNYYISSNAKSTSPQTLYYNSTDDTCKLVGYYLEVQ